MQISASGIAFIERNEGFSAHVYDDNGNECVGYGHDLQPGESFPQGVTPKEAEALLIVDLTDRFEPTVNALIPTTCRQSQFDALCDFAYNLGVTSLGTMLSHGWEQVPIQIPRWQNINGKPNAGLAARRPSQGMTEPGR